MATEDIMDSPSVLNEKRACSILACDVAALPFFQNTLTDDLIFNLALFGGMALAQWRLPVLREAYAA
ncbi:MAG: DUF6580 family putative transport protein [Chthoniobacteraceae bacterium]